MAATPVDISLIKDEDVLRRMWQETEDFGKKKEIRTHMYKLREARLRDFYSTGEVCKDIQRANTSPGLREQKTQKISDMSTHADSLADHSFLSLKSKEIRDSESPTREVYKIGNQGWNVTSTNESSPDGKTQLVKKVATISGTENIEGGVSAFAAKSEVKASSHVDGDDNNFTSTKGFESKSVIKQEAVAGDENTQIRSSSSKSSSSSRTVSEFKSTTGDTNQKSTLDECSGGLVQIRDTKPVEYIDGNTKVTQETHTLPDGTVVTRTRYETVGGSSSVKQTSSSTTSTTKQSTSKLEKSSLSVVTSTNEPSQTVIVKKSTIHTDDGDKGRNVQHTENISVAKHTDINIVENLNVDNYKNVDAIDVNRTTSVSKVDKTHNVDVSNVDSHSSVVKVSKTTQEFTDVKNRQHTGEFSDVKTTRDVNVDVKRTHEITDRNRVPSTTSKTVEVVKDATNKSVDVDRSVNVSTRVDEKIVNKKIVNEDIREDFTSRRDTKGDDSDVVRTKPQQPATSPVEQKYERPQSQKPKDTYEKSKASEGQYETTYRNDFTNKRISVDVSPTHDAFARSLRAVSPDRTSKCSSPSRGSTRSLRTSTTSLRSSTSPDKQRRSPDKGNRFSPDGKSPNFSSKRETNESHTTVRHYSNRSSPEKPPNRQRSPFSPTNGYGSPVRSPVNGNFDKSPTHRRVTPDKFHTNETVTKTFKIDDVTIDRSPKFKHVTEKPHNRRSSPEKSPPKKSPSPDKYTTNERVTKIFTITHDGGKPRKSPSPDKISKTRVDDYRRDSVTSNSTVTIDTTSTLTKKSRKSPSPNKCGDVKIDRQDSVNSNATVTVATKKKCVSPPRSASPTTTVSEFEYVRKDELVTDLDDMTTIVVSRNEKRPNSLPIDTVDNKSPMKTTKETTPTVDGRKKSPVKDQKSPTKDMRSPVKDVKDKPKDKPFKRTDTYEERCRQILGITKDTDTKKTKTETVERHLKEDTTKVDVIEDVKRKQHSVDTLEGTKKVLDVNEMVVCEVVPESNTKKVTEEFITAERVSEIVNTTTDTKGDHKKSTDLIITERTMDEPHQTKERKTPADLGIKEFPSQVRRTPERSFDKPEQIGKPRDNTKTHDLGIKEFPSQVRRTPERSFERQPEQVGKPRDSTKTPDLGIKEFPSQVRRTPEKSFERQPEQVGKPRDSTKTPDLGIKEFPSQVRKTPERSFDKPEQIGKPRDNTKTPDLGIKEFPSQIRKSPEKNKPAQKVPVEKVQKTTPTNLQEFPSQIRKTPERNLAEKTVKPTDGGKPKKLTDLGIEEFPSQVRRSPEKHSPSVGKVEKPKKTEVNVTPQKTPKSGKTKTDVFIKVEKNQGKPDSDSDESVHEKIEVTKNDYETYEGSVPVDEPLFVKKFIDTMCKHDECQRMNRCVHKVVKKDSAVPYPGAVKPKSPPKNNSKVVENQVVPKKEKSPDKTKGRRVITSITIHPKTPTTTHKTTKETTIQTKVSKETPVNSRVVKESSATPIRVTKESPTTHNRIAKETSTIRNRVVKETFTTTTNKLKETPTKVPKESSILSKPRGIKETTITIHTKATKESPTKLKTTKDVLQSKTTKDTKTRTTTRHGTVPLIKPQQNGVVDSDEETHTKVGKKILRTTSEKFIKSEQTGKKPERKTPTKEHVKNKCITTKSIIINNDVNVKAEIIVDLQRSKSSREQTPDRLCPLPVSSDDDSHTIQRYPDKITEPDDSFKKPKLSEAILEDENDRVEIHELNKITEVDRVNESDECLLTVNEKVSKFLDSAEKSKKTDTGSTFTKYDLTDGKEEVLSVTEKVNKFVTNVENVLKAEQNLDLERPKSPRFRNYDDGDLTVSEKLNKFIKTAEKVVSTENLQKKTEVDTFKTTTYGDFDGKTTNLNTIIKTPTNKETVEVYKSETCKTTKKIPYENETPKSTRRPSQEDTKSTMSTTNRLRSTESILKAKALFENISKKDTPKQRDILSRPSVFSKKAPEKPPESDSVCLKSTRLIMSGVESKSPDLKKRSRSNTPEDIPGYMRPLNRSERNKSKSPNRSEGRHSRSRSRSTDRSPSPDRNTPNYMKPQDRSLRPKSPHKESVNILENIGKKSTTEETFSVTLKDVGRTTKTVQDIDLKLPIEDIYDLALLEEMLVRATDYELRRRIRAQIRIVKKQEEEKSKSATLTRRTSKEIKKSQEQTSEHKFSSSTTSTTTERRSSTTTTTTTTSSRRSQSPQKEQVTKTPGVFTELKRTALPQKQTTKTEQPEWITQNKLKKVSERKIVEKTTAATVKKADTTKKRQSPVKETKPIDVITSSYGTGPVDENGTPLFGLKALRVKNLNEKNTKVQGSVVESKFYCESGKEPVGEVRHTKFSTDPKDLDLGNDISVTDGLTVVTTTKKFGREGLQQRNEQKEICDGDVRTTTKVTRRGSVKALSQKFIENAVETLKNERQTTYPKAGLILRTSSFKNEKSGGSSRDDSSEEETKKTLSSTMTVKTNVTKSDGSTFLTNRTKVTGVQDVIDRMRNSEEIHQGDTLEDAEARTLLNKFLGSQVLLSGMEEMSMKRQTQVQSQSQSPVTVSKRTSTKVTTTTTTGGKPTTVTRVFQHPVTEKELESVWDEQTLRLLLEQSTEYEERRIIRARLRQVMAEQEACTELVDRASREQAGGKIEGESLLLPLLQGLLDAPEKEQTADSGTESGEDLRNGLIMEVQCALEKLATSLKNDSTDVTPERKNSLLQLVTKLQAGLSSQGGGNTDKDTNTGQGRFTRKRLRQNRHTVGVSSEELANARKLMEEISFNDTENVNKSSNSLQKQNSESCVMSSQNNNNFRSVKAIEVKPIVKNATAKPFSATTSTASSSLDTPTESLDFLFYEPQPNTEPPQVPMRDKINRQYSLENEKNQKVYRRPLSEAVSLDCTKEFDPNTIHQAATLKKLQSGIESETDDDPSTVKAPAHEPPKKPMELEEKVNKFTSKKLKMKRANTIDIPKPQNFYEYVDDDSDSSLPEQDQNQRRRSNYLALRGPIRIGQPGGGGSKVPTFEPKTESDKKFMAFINKHNEANNVRNTMWTGQTNRGVWNNKFGNIKGTFEKVSKTHSEGSNTARNFWRSAEENRAPSRGYGNVKNLQESFEHKPNKQQKLPWASDPKNVVTGSIRVEPKAFHLSPKPINKFSHAPASAFKPIAKKLDGKVGDGPLFLYSPKPPFSPQTDSSNSSPVLPWSQNQEHRVLSIAAQKFEQPKPQPEPQGFKPKKLTEKWSYVEKPALPQVNRNIEPQGSSVRKLSGQYEAFSTNPLKHNRVQEEPKIIKGDYNEVRSKWMGENRGFSNTFGREPRKMDIKKSYEQPLYDHPKMKPYCEPADTKKKEYIYEQPKINFGGASDYYNNNRQYLVEPEKEYVSTVQFQPRRSPQTPQSGDSEGSRSPQNYCGGRKDDLHHNVYVNNNVHDSYYGNRNREELCDQNKPDVYESNKNHQFSMYDPKNRDLRGFHESANNYGGGFYGNKQNLYESGRNPQNNSTGMGHYDKDLENLYHSESPSLYQNQNIHQNKYHGRITDSYQSTVPQEIVPQNYSGGYQNQNHNDGEYKFLYQPSKSPQIDQIPLFESKVHVENKPVYKGLQENHQTKLDEIKQSPQKVDKCNQNDFRPKYDTQSSQESVHEYTAVTTKVMASPISCQAVTVRQKSPMSRDEHDLEAAFNLKQALRKFSQPDTKTSPTKTPEPPPRSKTPEKKFTPIPQNDQKQTPKFCVNDKPLESHEVNDQGETIVTTKFQIPVRKVPSPSQILSKSDSWHQICNQPQHKPSPRASPITKRVLKSKSSNTLALPKQFEAGMSKEEMLQKKKTMEAFFGGGDKNTAGTTVTKKSSINRIKTSQKLSVNSGLARSRTLPDIVCPQLLDESNVDKAFEDLFKSS